MESHTSGTLVGTGTFRCVACDYVVSLAAADTLPPCPSCGGEAFVRASLFTAAHVPAPSLPEASADDETAARRRARRASTRPASTSSTRTAKRRSCTS